MMLKYSLEASFLKFTRTFTLPIVPPNAPKVIRQFAHFLYSAIIGFLKNYTDSSSQAFFASTGHHSLPSTFHPYTLAFSPFSGLAMN